MTPDALAELEDERRFLLRSLRDLDREHDAGDVDDADYEVLRDGYTARAATVLRAIEEGTAALPPKRELRRGVVAAWVVGIVAVATVAGWLVARSSGQRLRDDAPTATAETDVAANLSAARAALAGGVPQRAAELYQQVLAVEPDNSEARTYIAWLLALSSNGASPEAATLALDQARASFEKVIASDPTYADAHCLYAVMAARLLPEPDLDLARREGQACLDNDPPGEMVQLVEGFIESL
jgi:tetratricopeptide (TPR) repeat protein